MPAVLGRGGGRPARAAVRLSRLRQASPQALPREMEAHERQGRRRTVDAAYYARVHRPHPIRNVQRDSLKRQDTRLTRNIQIKDSLRYQYGIDSLETEHPIHSSLLSPKT